MRVIAVTGLSALAGLAIGAGPAQASGSTTQPAVKPAAGQLGATPEHGRRDGIAGYYRTLGACALAGRVGVHFDRWDYFNCDLIRTGFRRGIWALEVDQANRWRRFGHAPVVADKPHGNKGDSGYGSKDDGKKDNDTKNNDTKNNAVKDDGYGAKDNGAKDDTKY
ncbi:hypothetical protein [Paractinoplanes maris]|uniref:hypothetical protein n=1 Tax=Paractinoplanes maris TaxID=1734446 RepID=UPI0020211330|nr:hypothetical protein [Actinoplanes maris]